MIQRRRLRVVALLLATATTAVTAACSSASSKPTAVDQPLSTISPSPTAGLHASPSPAAPTNPAAPSGPVEPLTGLPGTAGGAVVVVPMNVTAGGSAPHGLAGADVVSVDFGEHGLFHLAAMFQSHSEAKVGPAAEIRPSDLRVILQSRALIAQSGSPSGFLDVAKSIGLTVRKPGESGFSGDYVDTSALRSGVKNPPKPAGIFQYGTPGQPVSVSSVSTARKVSVKVSGHSTITWTFDAAKKIWSARVGAVSVSTANIVIITSPYVTKHVSAMRRDVTFANPLGQGKASVFAGSQHIAATWYKKNILSALNFLGPDQDTPNLVPGSTWILLVPSKAKVTVS